MTASLFATEQDLQDLTGYKQPRRQIRALVDMCVPFRVAPDGRPRVLIADLAPAGSTKRKKEPNLAALEKTT